MEQLVVRGVLQAEFAVCLQRLWCRCDKFGPRVFKLCRKNYMFVWRKSCSRYVWFLRSPLDHPYNAPTSLKIIPLFILGSSELGYYPLNQVWFHASMTEIAWLVLTYWWCRRQTKILGSVYSTFAYVFTLPYCWSGSGNRLSFSADRSKCCRSYRAFGGNCNQRIGTTLILVQLVASDLPYLSLRL